jgi:hypothetical protein
MAAVVEIQVNVDNSNAVAGVQQVSKQFEGFSMVMTRQEQEAARLAKSMDLTGISMKSAGAAVQQMSGNVATGLDSVRLLSQEFGLRMPRAIEAMLSRVPAVTTALSSIVGAMAALAAIEIFARLGEEMYKAFDVGGKQARALQKDIESVEIQTRRMNDELSVQLDKLQEEQAKLEHKPFNAMKETLDEAAAAADKLSAELEDINTKFAKVIQDMGGGWLHRNLTGGASGGHTDYESTMVEEHQRWLALATTPKGISDEETSYGKSLQTRLTELQGMSKNNVSHEQYGNEIRAIDLMMAQQKKEMATVDTSGQIDKTQGAVDADKAKAAASGAAKEAQKQREDAIALVSHLQHEANEASMRDDALANEKKLAEIDEIDKRLRALHATTSQFAAAEAAINKKYDDQRAVELQKQIDAAEKGLRDASIAGLTGLPKIEAEHKAHTDDIDASEAAPQVKQLRHQTVDLTYNQQVGSYYDENDMKEAEEQTRAAKAQQDAQTKALNQKLANQAEDLRYDQQTAQAEARIHKQGAGGWVASYKNAIAEIQDQETQRLAKLTEDASKEGLTYQEVAQRRQDIEREAGAQVAAQAQDMQHKIAGTLESAFKDPVGAIKDIMQKMFFDILSQWVSQLGIFKGTFAASMGGMSPGGAHGGGAGGLIQSIASGGGGFRAPYAGGAGSSISGAGSSSAASMSGGGASIAGDSSSGGGFSVGSALSSARNIGGMLNFGGGASTPSAAGNSVAMPSSDDTGIATIDTPSTGNVSGTPDDYATPSMDFSGGASTAMGLAGAAGGLYTGEQATVSAFEKGQPLQGAMADAAAGAAIGSIVPGIGTAIGAGIGAAVGLAAGALGAVTGMAGRMGARDYYNKSIYPQIEAAGSGSDYASGIAEADKDASNGMNYMVQHYGQDAANWVKSQYMDKELAYVITTITNRAKGGSGYLGASAAEFHTGGYIDGFGSLSTSSNEGYIHAMMGESVVNQQATSLHAPVINAMNSGASQSDVASMYLSGGKSNSAPSMGSGGDTHFHVHTLDTKTMTGWLRGGGARMISKAQNDMAGQYAGDGVIG